MFEAVYPRCFKHVGEYAWQRLIKSGEEEFSLTDFPEQVRLQLQRLGLPGYLVDLARLEGARWRVKSKAVPIPHVVSRLTVNPSLELLHLSWRLLAEVLQAADSPPLEPQPGEEWILIWRNQGQEEIQLQQATPENLLALKLVAEAIDHQAAAKVNQVSIGVIDQVLYQAVQNGILLTPPSGIRRNPKAFSQDNPPAERFLSASLFSLQWHITNACDLACKHCYDRTQPSPLAFEAGLAILDDLYDFCKVHFVRGQVCFTGGNPFLYPRFAEVYRVAAEHGFALSILGNPSTREQMEELLAIKPPRYFQLSLEGLKGHNDQIRGSGHYERTIAFLGVLKELGVSSSVMLTLTRDNLDQVLPLADQLQGLTDSFTFNRLSRVGEGVKLELPDQKAYTTFLAAYAEAAKRSPILHYKDNLFNILRYQKGERLLGGCTGYGCGAAFNFIAVLPDGEAHACRKFPSPIGNLFTQRLAEVYDSQAAQSYRDGCQACNGCTIRHACGGCLASSYSFGRDIYSQKDPHCFMSLPIPNP